MNNQDFLGIVDLLRDPVRVNDLPPEMISGVICQLAALQSVLAARLVSAVVGGNSHQDATRDHDLLSVTEAARKLRVSKDWLYRNKHLPFRIRMGRRILFSSRGIEKYICQRQGQ